MNIKIDEIGKGETGHARDISVRKVIACKKFLIGKHLARPVRLHDADIRPAQRLTLLSGETIQTQIAAIRLSLSPFVRSTKVA